MIKPTVAIHGRCGPFAWDVAGEAKIVYMFGRVVYVRVGCNWRLCFFERKIP